MRRYHPGGRLLDLGCGTGGVLKHLHRFSPAVGIDPSSEATGYCHQRSLSVAQASGTHLPFADGSFGAVLALDVIEHVDDDVALLREARRVLRPGGVAVLTVPALPWLWSDHDVVNHHRRRYVRRTLERSVRAAGLEMVKESYYNALLLPLAATRKVLHRMNGGGEHHLEDLPGPLNAGLRGVMGLERPLIARLDLPFGASLVCTARRSS